MEQKRKLFGYSYTNCRDEWALGILSEITTMKSSMQLSSRGCPTGAHWAYLGPPPISASSPPLRRAGAHLLLGPMCTQILQPGCREPDTACRVNSYMSSWWKGGSSEKWQVSSWLHKMGIKVWWVKSNKIEMDVVVVVRCSRVTDRYGGWGCELHLHHDRQTHRQRDRQAGRQTEKHQTRFHTCSIHHIICNT